MELPHDFNFNDPLELKEIFRNPEGQEFSATVAVCWEDLKGIEEYPYPDTWKKYPGEKYSITLVGQTSKLILGSFDSILRHWRDFRNKYPLFVPSHEDKDDDDEG